MSIHLPDALLPQLTALGAGRGCFQARPLRLPGPGRRPGTQ